LLVEQPREAHRCAQLPELRRHLLCSVNIPDTTAPGLHALNAQLMGGDAAQPVNIRVLAPNIL
jgi:hypothetical protein